CGRRASDVADGPPALPSPARRQTAGSKFTLRSPGMNSNVTPFRNVKHASMLWAAPERAEEIAALHAKLFNPAWDANAIRALLEHPAATSLIAVAGSPKAIIGFVIGQLAADEAEILSIGVEPNWQRAGVAAGLLEGLSRAARRGDAKR